MGERRELTERIAAAVDEILDAEEGVTPTLYFSDDLLMVRCVYDLGLPSEKTIIERLLREMVEDDINACFTSSDPRRGELILRSRQALGDLLKCIQQARDIAASGS